MTSIWIKAEAVRVEIGAEEVNWPGQLCGSDEENSKSQISMWVTATSNMREKKRWVGYRMEGVVKLGLGDNKSEEYGVHPGGDVKSTAEIQWWHSEIIKIGDLTLWVLAEAMGIDGLHRMCQEQN